MTGELRPAVKRGQPTSSTSAASNASRDNPESTIQVLEGFYPRPPAGGVCIVDDYAAMLSYRAAVEDYRRDHGVNEPIVDIDRKGVLWRKARGTTE